MKYIVEYSLNGTVKTFKFEKFEEIGSFSYFYEIESNLLPYLIINTKNVLEMILIEE